jgi:uncharacterized protein involved in exopolysaccharide biosynthesis
VLSSSRSKSFSLFTWWGTLLVSLVAAALAALCVAVLWPSTYTGASSFFVSTRSGLLTALAPQTPTPDTGATAVLKPTQERLAAILASRLLRARVATKNRLTELLRVEPGEAETLLAKMVQVSPIGQEGFTITVTCRGYSRARAVLPRVLVREDARRLCADLANSYLTEVQDYVTTTTVDEAGRKREFVETALRQVEAKLGATQAGLQRIQRQYELTDPPDKTALLSDRLKNLQQGRAEALATIRQSEASLRGAEGQLSQTQAMVVASIVQTRNPVIAQLEQKLAQAKVDLASQEAMGKTRQNRDVAQVLVTISATQEELRKVTQEIRTELSRQSNPLHDKLAAQVLDLRVTLAGARARGAETEKLLREARHDLRALPPVAQRFATLKQDDDVLVQTRSTLKQALAVALIQERQSKQAGEFLILDKAAQPPDLYGPPVLLAAVVVLVIGLCTLGLVGLNRSLFGP